MKKANLKISNKFISSVLIVMFTLSYMHYNFMQNEYIVITRTCFVKSIISTVTETSLIMCISYFLKKYRYTILSIVTLILLIVSMTNILYCRVFNSYVSLSLVHETQNLAGLASSIISLVNYFDLFYIFSVIATIFYLLISKIRNINLYHNKNITHILIAGVIFSTISLNITCMYGALTAKAFIPSTIYKSIVNEHSLYTYDRNIYAYRNGVMITYIRDILHKNKSIVLTDDDIEYIRNSTSRNTYENLNPPHNLILIIVESLMSFPINLFVNEIEITPNINSLVKNGYYNPCMLSQICNGMSSDGQFIYFTGMLPHKYKTTVIDFLDNEYHGLASHLRNKGINTSIIIPTTRNYWRQSEVNSLYGIDSLYSIESYNRDLSTNEKIDEWLNDEQIFNYSKWYCKKHLNKPFMLTVLTSSTHMPYYVPFKNARINFKDSNNTFEYLTYLQKLNYTDFFLGDFINYLKKIDLYRKTAIVIASDHPVPTPFAEQNNNFIPLLILNSGIDNIAVNDTISQVDLYPSIMDIMNIKSKWKGVGYSIYHNNGKKISYDEQIKISNLLLESNYFNSVE